MHNYKSIQHHMKPQHDSPYINFQHSKHHKFHLQLIQNGGYME